MSKIKILNTELEWNQFDADESEKIEKSVLSTQEKIDNFLKKEEMKNSEIIRGICHIVFECFNGIFGENTDKKIFGDKCNLLDCMEALGQLSQVLVVEQEKSCDAVIKKYLPNRQTRRASK